MTDYTDDEIEVALDSLRLQYGEDSDAFRAFTAHLAGLENVLDTTHDIVDIEQFISDPYFMGGLLNEIWPETVQSVKDVIEGGYTEAVFDGSIGRAKCVSHNTPIAMVDGSIRKVQDIRVGDLLLGPDSTPRKVEGLARGREEMFTVNQSNACTYGVNKSHILSLRHRVTDELLNISVERFIRLPRAEQQLWQGWKPANVNFQAPNQGETGFTPSDVRSDIALHSIGEGDYYGFTLSGPDRLFMLGDFTVTHNTTRATIVAAYNLYVLSALRYPQRELDLMSNSDIYGVMLNKTESLARKVTYTKFRQLIESIPYFQQHFMFDKSVESEMRFPNHIRIIASNADNNKLMGMDVLFGIVDEINFYDVTEKSKRSNNGGTFDQAIVIYDGLVRRIASRFEGVDAKIKGCISVVSSRAYKGDFTDRKIQEVAERIEAGKSNYTYISTGPFWTFVPQYRANGSQRFSDERFYVAVGTKQFKSEIIPTPYDDKGREVIAVPTTFLDGFEKDIEGSLRDIAGMVSGSTGSYFSDPEIVWRAVSVFRDMSHSRMFDVDEWDLADGMPPFNQNYRVRALTTGRFLHLDLSKTSDRTGLGIAYSEYDKKPRTRRSQTMEDFEQAPIVVFEDFIAIKPPKNGEISYASIRKLIYHITDRYGIKFRWISADSFQSNDMLQILHDKLGADTTVISVEQEEPYKALKNAFEEDRVIMPPHDIVISELLHVIKDEKGNIDHLPHLTKDVCDTAAGTYANMRRVYENGDLYKTNQSPLVGLYAGLNGGSRKSRNRMNNVK